MKPSHRALPAAVAAIGLLAFAAPPPSGGDGSAPPAGMTAPPPVTPGPAPDLSLVFSSQVVGWVEPCG